MHGWIGIFKVPTKGLYMFLAVGNGTRTEGGSLHSVFDSRILRAVLNPKTYHQAHKQNKYPHASFVCTLPFIAVSNRFSLCLDHCFHSFRSLFESISIDYKTLELNYFAFETFYLLPFFAYVSRPQLGPP